ncbi:MAG: hypothetical protein ACJ705_08515 [Nitrososphaeraceae archaeon]
MLTLAATRRAKDTTAPILLSDGEDISLDSNIEYSMEKEFREEGSL